MEDRIQLLPERVYNQIAAGEVVNRPASVVKEMMENSIDAGATEIIVNVRDCGRELIHIVDNGMGMTPNDARMAFERHATSKISAAEDIYALHTFGFRGEALASIGAVSQVELRTRYKDAPMGTVTTIHGGEFIEQKAHMCEQGTQFLVKNLFYNIPARRAFVEKESSRALSIKEEFRRVALCNPKVAFDLYVDDAPIYKTAPSSLAERIVALVGRNMKKNLLEVNAKTMIVKISGYIGRPDAAKKSMNDQYLFVNGRYFKSAYLNKAIMKGYEKIIQTGMFPAYFLFLEVEPDRIDVNVHPQKTEVKFADEGSVWQIVNAAVREALARTGTIPMMEFDNESKIEIPVMKQGGLGQYSEPRASDNMSYNPFLPDYETKIPSSFLNDTGEAEFSLDKDEEDIEILATKYDPTEDEQYEITESRYQAKEVDIKSYEPDIITYEPESKSEVQIEEWSEVEIEREDVEAQQGDLLANYSDKTIEAGEILFTSGRFAWCCIDRVMTVIDLRRAKERLLYDYYISTFTGGETLSQMVLFPIELRLSANEYALMNENAIEFSVLGFDIEYCEGELIKVNGLPADVSSESVDTLIYDLLQILGTPQSLAEQMRERLATVMARNSAQNMGRNLSHQAAKEIVDQLCRSGHTGHTPSGKAIMWRVTNEDIKQHIG